MTEKSIRPSTKNDQDHERGEAIETLEKLHSSLSRYAIHAQLLYRRIELALIMLSAVTTGALWALLAGVNHHLMAWLGAILSTIVTILTGYKKSLGPEEVYQRAAALYKKTGDLLAEIRSSDEFDSKGFWHAYKFIQAEMIAIRWVKGGRKGELHLPA